jgi:N-acyl-D-aspartate/D-glutamate deacylase
MGLAERPPTAVEGAAIAAVAQAGMADGAVGFSWGYHYPPNTFATTADLVAMGRAVAPHGVFSTHMRDYERDIAGSLDETFTVGRRAGIRVHVSHMNMHWEQGGPLIGAARHEGIDATYDTYPYLAGSTVLTRHLPDWALAGGPEATLARLSDPVDRERLRPELESPDRRWKSMLLGSIAAAPDQQLQGMAPLEAAAGRGQSITDFVCDLLIASRLEVGIIGFRYHRQNEDDLRRFLADPNQVVASDGIFVGSNPHPRGFGAFARVLGHYVGDEDLLPLPEAIRKMTSSTAQIFGLGDRGRIAVDAPADVVVFDPMAIGDRATYERGREPAVGVDAVLVNGVPAVLNARLTGDLAGQVIRGAAASNAARNVAIERAHA